MPLHQPLTSHTDQTDDLGLHLQLLSLQQLLDLVPLLERLDSVLMSLRQHHPRLHQRVLLLAGLAN